MEFNGIKKLWEYIHKNNSSRENDAIIPKSKKTVNERRDFWGYTFTVLALGFGAGALFGGVAYSLTATTDEKLIDDVTYYKEQRHIANNEVDSLKHENELLLSDKASLQKQLTAEQKDNKSLNESLIKANEDLKQYKDIELEDNKGITKIYSTSGKSNIEQKEVKLNESVSFFEGKIYVGASGIYTYYTDIQIGADGYESKNHKLVQVGSQIKYESDKKFQIRVVKLNFIDDKIVVQVKEI